MLVTCPNCKSVFKLPKQEDIDKKLRCSICKTVFAIRETEYKLEAGEEGSKGRGRTARGKNLMNLWRKSIRIVAESIHRT